MITIQLISFCYCEQPHRERHYQYNEHYNEYRVEHRVASSESDYANFGTALLSIAGWLPLPDGYYRASVFQWHLG